MTAKKTPRKKTVPGVNASKPVTPVAVDYSAQNVAPEIVSAAGIRNGMSAADIHAAIARVIASR